MVRSFYTARSTLVNVATGDEYRVTMLRSLRPRRISAPANYTPAPKRLLDRPSTVQDIAEFVAEYIYSDVRRVSFVAKFRAKLNPLISLSVSSP